MLALFVYGSLIDPAHRVEVLGHAADGMPATLHGFERRRSLHWYVRRCEGARTDGFLLTNLDAHDYATLDAYEEVPTLYTREQIEVTDSDGATVRCWIYLPTAWASASAE
jgi:gamma-glutamylcyclotransferase (GGCT)/AIG2-like uncharacterized protein YtfP